MDALLIAFGIVFVAELGDKTQLVVLTLGARQRPGIALAGLAGAAAVLMALAVTVGAAIGAAVPDRVIAAFAGVLFLGFAVWTWREAGEQDAATEPERASAGGHDTTARPAGAGSVRELRALVGAFFLAELGDKTQLTAASLAADHGAGATWIGATLGLVGATAIALFAGHLLARYVSARTLARAGAVLFAAVGVASLAGAAFG